MRKFSYEGKRNREGKRGYFYKKGKYLAGEVEGWRRNITKMRFRYFHLRWIYTGRLPWHEKVAMITKTMSDIKEQVSIKKIDFYLLQ